MAHQPAYNAYGELPTSEWTLLAVPEGNRIYVRSFVLYNKSGASVTAHIRINGRYFATVVLDANGGSARLVENDVPMVNESESITGWASASGAIDYIISTVINI